MDIQRARGHQVTYEVVDSPNEGKILEIDWCVGTYPRTGGYNHWTLSLYERKRGVVIVTYDSTVNKGESVTVGVQNLNRGFFRQFSHNNFNSVTSYTILEFHTFAAGGTDIYRYGY